MSEPIYAEADVARSVHFDQGDNEKRTFDNCVSTESLAIYDNPWVEGPMPPDIQDTGGAPTQHPATTAPNSKSSVTASKVCLGLFCLLLLAVTMALGIEFSLEKSSWEKKMDEINTSYRHIVESLNAMKEEFQLSVGCDDGWQRFGCSCYYVSDEKKKWRESRDACQEQAADLVIINSPREQEFLLSFNKSAWIGLRERQGTWTWVDGTELEAESGVHIGVSIISNNDCAEINAEQDPQRWNAKRCEEKKYWICERSRGV